MALLLNDDNNINNINNNNNNNNHGAIRWRRHRIIGERVDQVFSSADGYCAVLVLTMMVFPSVALARVRSPTALTT